MLDTTLSCNKDPSFVRFFGPLSNCDSIERALDSVLGTLGEMLFENLDQRDLVQITSGDCRLEGGEQIRRNRLGWLLGIPSLLLLDSRACILFLIVRLARVAGSCDKSLQR